MFNAQEEKIRRIFAGDNRYIIPRNQRKYVWNEKQWQDLLGDIEYIYEIRRKKKEASHFIGSFVLQEKDGAYEIIDGQQRITTLLLALGALACRFNEIAAEDEFGRTRQYIKGDIGIKSEYIRLENKDVCDIQILLAQACEYNESFSSDKIFEQAVLHKENAANKLVYDCINFFFVNFSKYKTEQELSKLREVILDMKVIRISSEDEIDCYDVFEVLNARGVDLQESELLKNYVFKYAQPKYNVDKAKEIWIKAEKKLADCNGDFEQFLTHYVTYRFGAPTKTDGVYHKIKTNVKKTDVYILLNNLLEMSECYASFYAPEKAINDTIGKCLSFYKMVNHRQFRPLFMALFAGFKNNFYSEKQITDICLFLRNFSFAYTLVMGSTSNMINERVHKLAQNVFTNHDVTALEEIKSELKKYYPSEADFTNAFRNIGFSNKGKEFSNSNNRKRMKYIHSEYEEYLQRTGELSCNTDSCNLEHIMCDSEMDPTTYKIGNILLISGKINEKMASDSFEKKKERLINSRLLSVQAFIEHYGDKSEWTHEMIIQRTDNLAKLAYNEIWKLN